jgi:C1A family cysteine protease
MATVALIVVSFLFLLPYALVLAQETGQAAPMNPQFLEYMAQKEAARLTGSPLTAVPEGAHPTGGIPSPIDFSYLLNSERALSSKRAAVSYPASFDLRAKNKVTPVRDQGSCGACWAFASVASAESSLMPTVTDFSEQFIIDTSGYDQASCSGGTLAMAIADMARHGVVDENLYPYEYLKPGTAMPAATQSAWTTGRLQSAELLTAGLDSQGNPIISNIKNALYSGSNAVALGFKVIQKSPYLVTAENGDECYYNNTTTQGGGHFVTVVGWNDNYPADNFGITPPGNGAYLIKNSWGTGWGNKGYFWMSYYDKSVYTDAYAHNSVMPLSTYNWVYQYDTLGWMVNWGWSNSTTGSMANVFKASPEGKVIRAVSFYTVAPNTEFSVAIYDRCPQTGGSSTEPVINPIGGTRLTSESGTFPFGGYHTYTLKKPVTVTPGTTAGENFSVVVTLTDTTKYNYPLPLQNAQSTPNAHADVLMGQSYISNTGAEDTWFDLASYNPSTQAYSGKRACLKAFGTSQ